MNDLLSGDNGLWLIGLCAVFTGVMAGFFWSFSVLVMPGLERQESNPSAAMAAMQGINNAVQSPIFALFFAGTPLLCLLALVRAAIADDAELLLVDAIAAAVYLIGVVIVTFALNIPLNNQLDKLDPENPADTAQMSRWILEWSRWNHIRTVSGIVATSLFVGSLVWQATH